MLAVFALAAAPAAAQEARIGIVAHDIDGFDAGVSGKESGASINLEYVWAPFDGPNWFLSPRPYIGGNIHLDGKTSFGGGGLMWRGEFSDRWYASFAFGLVVHDGEEELPDSDPNLTFEENLERIRINNENIEFGSRVLFREDFALGYRFTEAWAGEIFYEHLSHGNILSDQSNEGLDNVGLRLARRF